MKILNAFGAMLLLALALTLTGCDRNENVIRIFNWGDYMDGSIFAEFTELTGIEVRVTYFASNEEMHTRVTAGGTGAGFDLLFPSDFMIERMIREELLRPINLDNIPNLRYIDQRFLDLPFDPGNRYSVPYKWGTLGILYNRAMVDAIAGDITVDSWNILWDERFEGNIFMYDTEREVFTVALKLLGYSINTTSIDELHAARDLLKVQRPLVRAFIGDPVRDSMIGREAALAMAYSGDAMFTMAHNNDLNFVVPMEGTSVWYDAMVIPRSARNPEGAEAFINFLSDPAIALRNTLYSGYSTANRGAFEMLPEEIRNNPIYWPPYDVFERSEPTLHLGDFIATITRAWEEVLAHR